MKANNCATDKLVLFAFDELSSWEKASVTEHVAGCQACAAELRELMGGERLLSTLPLTGPSRSISRAIRHEARRAVRKPALRRLRDLVTPSAMVFKPSYAAAVATVVLIVCSFVLINHQGTYPASTATQILKWEDNFDTSFSVLSSQPGLGQETTYGPKDIMVDSSYLANAGISDATSEFHETLQEIEESIELLTEQSTL
ncbi:zf-HC2 domain-containing protein [bacterium]|nr:zf-HC2 domain-containing protein [candidate division CSSED10-310 bacterium]